MEGAFLGGRPKSLVLVRPGGTQCQSELVSLSQTQPLDAPKKSSIWHAFEMPLGHASRLPF